MKITGIAVAFLLIGCGPKSAPTADSARAIATTSSVAAPPSASASATESEATTDPFKAKRAKLLPNKDEWKKHSGEVPEIVRAYEANAVKADAEYKGKPRIVVGVLDEIGKDPDGAYLEMFDHEKKKSEQEADFKRVKAYIDESDGVSMDRAAALKKGSVAAMICSTSKGFDGGMYVEFDGCTLVPEKEKPTSTSSAKP